MIKRGVQGSIVNISSRSGVVSSLGTAPYGAAKGGMNNYTRSMAVDWAQDGIRVNAIAPGFTMTPLTREFGFRVRDG